MRGLFKLRALPGWPICRVFFFKYAIFRKCSVKNYSNHFRMYQLLTNMAMVRFSWVIINTSLRVIQLCSRTGGIHQLFPSKSLYAVEMGWNAFGYKSHRRHASTSACKNSVRTPRHTSTELVAVETFRRTHMFLHQPISVRILTYCNDCNCLAY